MKPSARPIRIGLVLLAVGTLAAACMGGTFAAFTSTASNPGNAVTAANDFRAPSGSEKAAPGVAQAVARSITASTRRRRILRPVRLSGPSASPMQLLARLR